MADMTHKHHNLIYDAIKDASAAFIRSSSLAAEMDKIGVDNVVAARRINRAFVRELAKSFSTKLRYTNDKFEATVWQRQVEAIADEVFDTFVQESA